MFKFGDRVKTNKRLIRRRMVIDGKPWRKWEPRLRLDSNDICIFLGYRTLQNGIVYYEYDFGMLLDTHEYIRVSLVCPNERQNPFYAPIDSLQEV
jgi:hypothetical protein